jgi:dATP/dGTP diphosphohydrolase
MSGVNESWAKERIEANAAYYEGARRNRAALGHRQLGEQFASLADEVQQFNTVTIEATVEGAVAKVGHEALEFVAEPSLKEARDLLITLLGWLRLSGYSEEELVEQARIKMDENFQRTWVRMPDGSYQHCNPTGPCPACGYLLDTTNHVYGCQGRLGA